MSPGGVVPARRSKMKGWRVNWALPGVKISSWSEGHKAQVLWCGCLSPEMVLTKVSSRCALFSCPTTWLVNSKFTVQIELLSVQEQILTHFGSGEDGEVFE